MAKRDYSDFIEFVKKHQNDWTQTKIYNEYRKQQHEAGKKGVQKKQGFEIIRQVFGYEKGEKRGKVVHEKLHKDKAVEYKFLENITKPLKDIMSKRSHYITLDKKKAENYDLNSPVIKMLKDKISNMFGYDSNTFIQIDMIIDDDGYTQDNKFSVWIPFNRRYKQGVKAIGGKIISNLNTYYNNLAKRYSEKLSLKNNMLDNLGSLKKELNRSKGIDEEGLRSLFAEHGINIEGIQILNFTDKRG